MFINSVETLISFNVSNFQEAKYSFEEMWEKVIQIRRAQINNTWAYLAFNEVFCRDFKIRQLAPSLIAIRNELYSVKSCISNCCFKCSKAEWKSIWGRMARMRRVFRRANPESKISFDGMYFYYYKVI